MDRLPDDEVSAGGGGLLRRRREQTASSSSDTSTSPSRRLTKYGASGEQPKDDAVFYPDDDKHGFFARGRDFESAFVNHKYTAQERDTLATYESMDYLPSHSVVYKNWIKRQPARLDWDRWVMMGLIGFTVGFMGFLLHQIIDVIADFKWEKANEFIQDDNLVTAWGWVLGYSQLFVIVGTALVVFLRPSAGGSGIPELIGFLNGTVVRHIFNVRTLGVKFLSAACAVGSGMPVGPEGPMIHMGSLVGAGVSQFKSDTLRFKLPFFERFRNSEDRRNFISAGAAAGVASAFGAPVGGLLFSMEEVSSFWNMKLSWQIFFCAMVSTFTTDLFNSAFTAFRYQGDFGLFKAEKYILFQVSEGIAVNILAFIPAVILGFVGGVLGALFTFINLKIARGRKRLLSRLSAVWKQQTIRMVEPIIIMIVVATVSVFLPAAFKCSQYTCMHPNNTQASPNCLVDSQNPLHVEPTVQSYTCPEGVTVDYENYTWTNKTFNQVATLLFVTGEQAIHHLFSRNTHMELDYPALATVLLYYFIMACWAAGTSISSGLVVPMLMIGGLYGRMVGKAMVSFFGIHMAKNSFWAWMDPGAFALVGAASFFGGVSRLTMSLTVIMIEITNDVQFLLPIMAAIMVAKWVGDFFTHPLYHAILELKCIPFLDAEPVIRTEAKEIVNLELYNAKSVMTRDPVRLSLVDNVQRLAQVLLSCPHGGFPVIKTWDGDKHTFFGFINRLELTLLLKHDNLFQSREEAQNTEHDVTAVEYHMLTLDKLHDPEAVEERLQDISESEAHKDLYINLEPYTNQSAVCIQEKFSLHRTYIIFRTLGLRHLTVVDEHNQVMGVITRKDLMGFNMEEKLSKLIDINRKDSVSGSVASANVQIGDFDHERTYRGLPT